MNKEIAAADILEAEAELPNMERTAETNKPKPATTAVAHFAPSWETDLPLLKEACKQPNISLFSLVIINLATASKLGKVKAISGIMST